MWSFSDAHRRCGRRPDPWTLDGLAEIAGRRGLGALEIDDAVFRDRPDEAAEIASDLVRRGVRLIVDTHGGDELPETVGTGVEAALVLAARLGASTVRTTISNCLEGDRRRYGRDGWKQRLAALVAPMKKAALVARDLNVPFGVENHQDISSWELAWLCEEVDSPYFGVVLDTGNALAVGEYPPAFTARVLPFLKLLQLKDYLVHPTPEGWRLARCPLGSGIVDFRHLIPQVDHDVPETVACIELGATSARHVRLLSEDWWSTFEPRSWPDNLAAIRALHANEQPWEKDWRTPHERQEPPEVAAEYEIQQLDASIAHLRELNDTHTK